MKTRLLLTLLLTTSLAAFAPGPGPHGGRGPRGGGPFGDGPPSPEQVEARERQVRMMMVVAISEALELNEAEALKMSERLKGLEGKRRPVRQQMGEAMKALKDAAEGDQAALAQVDANVQRVLDGRAQMAALDKELFQQLSQGLAPQKKAKLALALGRLNHELRGGGFKKGRHFRD
jgi:hypothetical protein